MAIPKNTLEWQALTETYDPGQHPPNSYKGYTYRASVPGGWLVAVWAGENDFDHAWGGGLTFVPDSEHLWKVAVRDLPIKPLLTSPPPRTPVVNPPRTPATGDKPANIPVKGTGEPEPKAKAKPGKLRSRR